MESRLQVVQGDIVTMDVDAIVNAANERLLGGGGVDGAIHRAAGPELLEACRRIPEIRPGVRCPTGEARITPGFRLAARCVIHAVGPVWRGGGHGEAERLAACYHSALSLAKEHDCTAIAFPAISTGIFGYPADAASRVAVAETRQFLTNEPSFRQILLVAFSPDAAAILTRAVSS
jgi:O-acetyl-ADP-ribose deacetylase (regulator of RNase III)